MTKEQIKAMWALIKKCETSAKIEHDTEPYLNAIAALGDEHAAIKRMMMQNMLLMHVLDELLPMAENMYLHGQATMGIADKANRSAILQRAEETLIQVKAGS